MFEWAGNYLLNNPQVSVLEKKRHLEYPARLKNSPHKQMPKSLDFGGNSLPRGKIITSAKESLQMHLQIIFQITLN